MWPYSGLNEYVKRHPPPPNQWYPNILARPLALPALVSGTNSAPGQTGWSFNLTSEAIPARFVMSMLAYLRQSEETEHRAQAGQQVHPEPALRSLADGAADQQVMGQESDGCGNRVSFPS